MKKCTITSLIGLVLASPVFAAENINLNNVVITASRIPQPRESVIADISVIAAEEIQRGGQTTLVELLQMQPGLEINNAGGTGKPSGIFMRGTNSNHVVVLIDGMRVSSATLGTTAFENLPINQIDRIEILRGAATSLYGHDAIGGVIQIFTKKGTDEGIKLHANAGYGTYDTKIGGAVLHGRIGDTSVAFSLSTTDTEGFSALDSHQTNVKDDDRYRNLTINANVSQALAEGHEIVAQLFNSDGTNHYDNRFNTSNYDSKVKMNQQVVALFSKNQWTPFWLSNLRVGFSKDKLKNFDELFLPTFTRFDTEQTQINWQNDFKLPLGTLTLMYDRLEDEVDSTNSFTKTSRVNQGYVASYIAEYQAHSFQASYRNDQNSQYGHYDTGNLGYGYKFSPSLRVTGSIGNALKAPTFNDLYYPFNDFGFGFSYTGNPNLKPERSFNKELSLHYTEDNTAISATVYHNKIKNLILGSQNIPADTAINLGKVTLEGLTLTASQQWDNLALSANADIQSPRDDDSRNLLPHRANRHGALGLSYNWADWNFGAEVLGYSKRYEDKDNTRPMAGYALLNFTAQYHLNKDWSIQARANNVLDKNYKLSLNGFPPFTPDIAYNTPGANLFVNIRYQPE